MSARVKVGDTVVFNDNGLDVVYGGSVGLAFMKGKRMKVTRVDLESMTEPEEVYVIEVDDPHINQFFLYDAMFDVVKP